MSARSSIIAEFLGPVWTFYSFVTTGSGSFQNRTTACYIFPFVGVSDCFACWTADDEHVFRVFCQKGILYTGIFKVCCLGNNLWEKYAFTWLAFIQHPRSTLWLISTEACNTEASNFAYLLRIMLGFFSPLIRSKEIFLLKYGIRELETSMSIEWLVSESSSP